MTTLSDAEISNKKLAAGLLGIFLGSFGVHKFVLGYNNAGIIMLVVSIAGGVVTCGDEEGVGAARILGDLCRDAFGKMRLDMGLD